MTMRLSRYDVVFYVPSVAPLLVKRGLPPGGAETQTVLLARELARRGATVCIVSYDLPDCDVPSSVDGIDIVVRPPYPGHQKLPAKAREAIRILKTMRRIDAASFVTRSAGQQVGLVAAAAKLRRRNFIYSTASILDFDFDQAILTSKRVDRQLYRLGVKLAGTIVVQTEEQIDMCKRAFNKEPVLIKSVAEPAPVEDHRPEAFLWVGRLVWYKRPLAFVELARSLPNLPFRMVGVPTTGHPDADQVATAAEGIANLELLTPRPHKELVQLMDRTVAVVNTSDFEGIPNIFLEGWSRGIPALALTHDPDSVITTHRIGEFAAGSRDRFVSGADRLWRTRFERDLLARRCRAYVLEHHSPEVIAAQWLQTLGLASSVDDFEERAV
jgi:glycosyltransferase involved in cell wall biosynthesis